MSSNFVALAKAQQVLKTSYLPLGLLHIIILFFFAAEAFFRQKKR